MLERELAIRASPLETQETDSLSRCESSRRARTVWRDAGYVKTDRIRTEFMRLTQKIGLPEFTAPKLLRHLFATSLQDANVDPLIRCELMGHATQASRGSGHPLEMTATYTHSRPETKRRQLESASMPGPAVAESWLKGSLPLQTHVPAG
jgi:site-specific recombinase XerC